MTFLERIGLGPFKSRAATQSRVELSVAIICIAPLRNSGVPGGAYAATLGEALQGNGMRVELWTRKSPEMHAEFDVPVRQVWRAGPWAWLDILKAVIERRPRIVHLQHFFFLLGNGAAGELSTMLLMFCLALVGSRVVVTLHDVPGKEQITPEYVKLHKYNYPASFALAGIATLLYLIGKVAREIIVLNEFFAERLARFGVDPRKINVIPHMPPPAHPVERSCARKTLGLDGTERIVLFFGFATAYKGIELLLSAFEILEERGSKVRLLLGAGFHPKVGATRGYPEYYSALETKARSIELVDFVGFIDSDDLDTYLSAADLGILPYVEYHGASGPLYYYMSHERPVLVSTCIAQHTPGFHSGAFATSPAAIADAISRFFEDESFRDSISRESAELRRTLLSDAYLIQTRNVYDKALRTSFSGAS